MTADPDIPYGYNADGTFPCYREDRHLLTFGPTRSGKGATVIVQALLDVRHSVICIDPKGQNAAITARQRRELHGEANVFCLNPFGLHTGAPWCLPKHRFNPLAHLTIESDTIVADVASLAEALVISEGREPFFTDAARDLIKAILLHLIATKGGRATLPELRRQLTLPRGVKSDGSDDEFGKLIFDMIESPQRFIRQLASPFVEKSRTIQSVIAVAMTQTTFLDDPMIADALGGSDFDMMQLKRTPSTVFLILPGRYMEAYARFFRLLVTSAIDQLTSTPGGYPTLMMLDEFATLQNLPAISKAFGFAAGFNLQCWAFLQDIPQLKAIYDDRWESFVANAGLLQFFTPADMTTAEYLERRGGEKIGELGSRQSSAFLRMPRGVTQSETRVPLLPIETTMNMPPDEQIVFFGGKHSPRRDAKRKPYWQIPRLKKLWDRDPYHDD